MPAFKVIEALDDGCWLGTITRANTEKWYVRMYWPGGAQLDPQNVYKSTKIKFEGSKGKAYQSAKRKANQLWAEFNEARDAGDNPIKPRTIQSVVDAYLDQITHWASENEKADKPIYMIKGGRSVRGHSQHWTHAKVEAVANILGHLKGFWATLPTQDFRRITERDLAYFSEWAAKTHDWSPNWTNRNITQIRMIWRFAFDGGWAEFIPKPFRSAENLRDRARRNLTEEEWLRMVYWARDKYDSIRPTNKAAAYFKDTALQFWVWLNVISWSGIRPPSGAVIKNLIRWEDIRRLEDGSRIISRKDKTEYDAPILEPCYALLDFYKEWQAEKGLGDSQYLFAHTRTKEGYFAFGDPILSFRKQWANMLNDLGLKAPPKTPQSQKLVPYALRGFFITMSIRNGVDVRKLANSLGTSERVIDQTYYDFQTEKEIAELMKRASVADLGSVTYDEDGYPILR